jgi:hypothetical protein
MIVVHHPSEPRSQRILWLLKERQAPYEGRVLPARRAHQSGAHGVARDLIE